jgi:hypothetical protein
MCVVVWLCCCVAVLSCVLWCVLCCYVAVLLCGCSDVLLLCLGFSVMWFCPVIKGRGFEQENDRPNPFSVYLGLGSMGVRPYRS